MDGQEVFKFAVTAMCRGLRGSIRDAGLSEADIDWVLPHQANMRIIEFAMSKMKIPPERFLINIERLANTSAACIPILLDESREQGKLKKGDLLAMCAFGAGLTSARGHPLGDRLIFALFRADARFSIKKRTENDQEKEN